MAIMWHLKNPKGFVKGATISILDTNQSNGFPDVGLSVETTEGFKADHYKSILAAKIDFGKKFMPKGKWA